MPPDPLARPGERELHRSALTNPKPCRSCGAPIVFERTLTVGDRVGKFMPMSLRSAREVPCSTCSAQHPADPLRGRCGRCSSTGKVFLLLTHFADCPDAAKHRRAKRRRDE